jgi:hypothetical protein
MARFISRACAPGRGLIGLLRAFPGRCSWSANGRASARIFQFVLANSNEGSFLFGSVPVRECSTLKSEGYRLVRQVDGVRPKDGNALRYAEVSTPTPKEMPVRLGHPAKSDRINGCYHHNWDCLCRIPGRCDSWRRRSYNELYLRLDQLCCKPRPLKSMTVSLNGLEKKQMAADAQFPRMRRLVAAVSEGRHREDRSWHSLIKALAQQLDARPIFPAGSQGNRPGPVTQAPSSTTALI